MKLFIAYIALMLLGVIALVVPAEAQDDSRWAKQVARDSKWSCNDSGCRYRPTHRRRYYQPEPIRYYGPSRYERELELRNYRDEPRQHGRCDIMRRVVGDQHLTVDGAKKAANDAWAAHVRFHLGESSMSLDNAREIRYVCSRSSIKEGGVATLGQTLTRCEVAAIPCKPAPQTDEKDDR